MTRLKLSTTQEGRERSEFFKGTLTQAKRALKAIGRGEYFEFSNNKIEDITQQTLIRGEQIETTQVKLRESPRLVANRDTVDALSTGDEATTRAVEKVSRARRSPRFVPDSGTPMTITMDEDDLGRLRSGDAIISQAITKLRDVKKVRRSKRLAELQKKKS